MISVQAQKDVTAQYITNATLSSLAGWTNVNFNAPQQGNNTVGYASEAYAGWGSLTLTNYSLTQNITLPAGHYTLVNYSFYRYGEKFDTDASKSLAFLKAGDQEVAVKTLGSITASTYANSQAQGANCFDSKMYRNTLDFTIDADNTTIEIGVYGTHDLMRSWMILGMFELINNDILATMDSPFDVTGYITNPGFEYGDLSGWTVTSGALGVQSNNQGFKVGGWYAEKWQASGALPACSMTQTITNLPAGYYTLTANLGGNGTYVDVNGTTANWTEDKDYVVGYVLSEDEPLTITAGKTEEGTANWIHFDNFRLKFCGDVQAALSALIDELNSYMGTIPTAAFLALKTNVESYDHSYSDINELLAAITAVQELYLAADALKAPYATAKSLLATAISMTEGYPTLNSKVVTYGTGIEGCTTVEQLQQANTYLTTAIRTLAAYFAAIGPAYNLQAVPNDNPGANEEFKNDLDVLDAGIDVVELTQEGLEYIIYATAEAKSLMTNYVRVANPVGDGNKFNCTFLLTNPDLTPYWTGAWGVQPEGWFTDQEGGNFQVMQNNSVDAEDGEHKIFMEYYYLQYDPYYTWDNGNFNIYTAATLPEGTFTMSCYAFAKEENYSSGNPNPQVYFYANDTQGSLVDASKLTAQEISFVNNAEQEVKIGLKPLTGNTYNWMGIGYVELYKVPAKTYTVDENEAWDYTTVGAGNVTLNRTIKEGINTVVFPFSMTQEEVETYFGEGSKVYVVSAYNAETENLTFATKTDGISANIPCLLKATVAGSSYELADRMISAATSAAPVSTTTDNKVSMIGNYNASEIVPAFNNNYVINSGKVYLVDSNVTIKGTRAYIKVADANEARELILNLDGDPTIINAIEAADEAGAQEGKFFENNKIVIVKNGKKFSADGQLLK